MSKYEKVSYDQVVNACDEIADWVRESGIKFKGIYGPPRGGLVPAVILSHKTGLKYFEEPRVRPLLIVDDIADTGKTLNSLSKLDDVYVVTIHYHYQSMFVPDKWVLKKEDKWIVYPWEKEYWEGN
jgi:hypoxanthine phosphoribosyltransferase